MDNVVWRCLELTSEAERKYDPISAELERDLQELTELTRRLFPIPRKKWNKEIIQRLYHKQDGICACGCRKPLPDFELHVDHIVPWSKGGGNNLSNLQLLVSGCNLKKGAVCDIDAIIQALEDRLLNLPPCDWIGNARGYISS